MSDFDVDFLGEAPVEATPSKSTQQIEDELFDFLDTPTATTTFTTPAKDTTGFTITSQSMDDSQDFLSWLEETPTAKSSSFIKAPALPTVTEEPASSSEGGAKESMDNFFDEVFGGDSVPSPSPSSKSNAFFQSDSVIFITELNEIIGSSFPDVAQLKQVIFNHGYVPNSLRAQVWTLILSGNCSEDDEMRQFNSSAASDLANKKTMLLDCKDFSKSLSSKSKQEQACRDMSDVLQLYCQRRNLTYQPIYGMLLSPLMAVSDPASKALSSSCFYGLTSSFAPLLSLNVSAVP